jgi:hypothetical protein
MRVGTHHPPTYENGFFYPLNFLKQDKSQPEAVEDHVWFEDRWIVASLCDE